MFPDERRVQGTVEGRTRPALPLCGRAQAGFTLVELLASVALLIVLLAILFFVFGQASQAVSVGRSRMARYRTVRAVFRLMEEDITSAFLITDAGNTYGFEGEDGTDPAFLTGGPDSDRLTLVCPRRGYDATDSKPGFVEICYLRLNRLPSLAGRANLLLRAMDQEENGRPGTYEGSAPPGGWQVGDSLPLGFPLPDQGDGNYSAYLTNHSNDFENYLLGLNVSGLQFDYLEVGTSSWPDSGDWDCGADGLPAAVKVTLRLGPTDSTALYDHETFTHTIFLPAAP